MASRCIAQSCSRLSTSIPSSATQAVFQLTPRRCIHNAPPVLDFLLPNVTARNLNHGLGRQTKQTRQHVAQRPFTTSVRRQEKARVLHNPQEDDDGKEMTIEITPRASKRLAEIMTKDKNSNLALRITVSSGGCHGFQYDMSLVTLPSHLTSKGTTQEEVCPAMNTSSADPNALPTRSSTSESELKEEEAPALNTSSNDPNAMPTSNSAAEKAEKAEGLEEEDVVFGAADGSGAMVVLDGPSLEYLKDSKVHYTEELIGSQFVIIDNPLATSSCGCGTSFDIKM